MRIRSLQKRVLKWVTLTMSLGVGAIWWVSHDWNVSFHRGAELNPLFSFVGTDDNGICLSRATTDADDTQLKQLRQSVAHFGTWWPSIQGWLISERLTGISTFRTSRSVFPTWHTIHLSNPCQPVCTCGLNEHCRLQSANFYETEIWIPYWIPFLISGCFSLFLFWQDRPYPKNCCRYCGYDLRLLGNGICPECGKTYSPHFSIAFPSETKISK